MEKTTWKCKCCGATRNIEGWEIELGKQMEGIIPEVADRIHDTVKQELDKAREEGRKEIAHKIIELDENTPKYTGNSELLEIGGKYFRSWDAEHYASGISEITKEEFDRLLKYKLNKQKK
jgi:coenzyme F420-reducing hydrogenase alpha subunit